MIAEIEKLGVGHVQRLDDLVSRHGDDVEDEMAEHLLRRVDGLVRRPDCVSRTNVYTLHFDSTLSLEEGADREAVMAALVAGLVENSLQPALSTTQRAKLADTLMNVTARLNEFGYRRHALEACSVAATLYQGASRHSNAQSANFQTRCLERRLNPKSWDRRVGVLNEFFTGYGYRPYRLLWLAFVLFLVFSSGYASFGSLGLEESLLMSAYTQLGLIGFSDVATSNLATQALVAAQAGCSLVLVSTFFALVVQRWFRP